MAVLSDGNLTLADWTTLHDPKGKPAAVAKLLMKQNDSLDDMVHVEANATTHHTVTIETSLPAVYWRQFNEGIEPSKGTHAQVQEGIGMMETRTQVDKKLIRLGGNLQALRMRAAQQKVSAMRNEQASVQWYGNSAATPAKYMGFAPRYSQHTNAGNSQNVINADTDATGTTGAVTSIWLIAWGDDSVYCTFPQGSVAGLEQQDLGEQSVTVFNAAGASTGKMQAYEDVYGWDCGIVVADWRQVARICNIEVADLQALADTQVPTSYKTILKQMLAAYYRIETTEGVRLAFYMNRTVHEGLATLAMEKTSSVLRIEEGFSQFGTPRKWTSFMGIPIRRSDSILNTEALVAA